MQKEDFEQALVLIKPDALKNSLTGYVLSILSEFHTGLHFAATKVVTVSKMLAEEHYAEHCGKPFYPALLEYITGCLHYPEKAWRRRVIALVYQGKDATRKIRQMAGLTDPHKARAEQPGCIRSLGTIVPVLDEAGKNIGSRMDNLVHASATVEEGEREIKLWFMPSEIPPLMRTFKTDVCQEHFYLKDGKVILAFEEGAVSLFTPGDIAWKSDLEAIELLSRGDAAPCSLGGVAAKYLLNRTPEE